MSTLDAAALGGILTRLSAAGGQSTLGVKGVPHVAVRFGSGRLVFETFDAVCGAQAVLEDKRIDAPEEGGETHYFPLVELRELVRRFGGEISFGLDGNGHLLLSSAGSKYTIKSILPDAPVTYPFADAESEERFEMPAQALLRALHDVLVVARSSAGRSYSSGTLFDFRGHEARLVNTDGFRMAVVTMEEIGGITRRVQVDTEALKALLKALAGAEGVVEGEVRPDHVLFVNDGFRFHVTTLTVTYPDYEKILDRPHPGEIAFDRKEMVSSLERLQLIGKYQEQNNAVLLTFKGDEATLEIDETLRGVGVEPLGLVKGPDETFRVALNGDFLLDFLRAAKEDEVTMRHESPHTSCLFQGKGAEAFRYFLMTLKHPKVASP